MANRFFFSFFLLGIVIFTWGLSASGNDTSQCAQVFESNCAECHEIDRGCELLGQPEKEWEALFDFMEDMGADLPDDEKMLLITCLSKPDEAVKKTCQN